MTPWRIAAVIVAVGLVVVYAVGSGRWVSTGSAWYQSLAQPAWQPPGAVFGLAWTYNFIALAVVGVAMSLGAPASRVAVFLAALGRHASPWPSAGPTCSTSRTSWWGRRVALTACALLTLVPLALAFAERPWLGWVLVPYQAWLVIATSLSWGYVALSR